MRPGERTLEWLERHTSESRSRNAESIFLHGRARGLDRFLSWLYFAVAAGRWEGYEQVDVHLAAFTAGLDRCHSPARALDIGTGTGGAAAAVALRFPAASVVAVDTSRPMLHRARARHRLANLEFRRASTLRLPFDHESFDLVICVNAVPDLNELGRVLADDGEVLLAATTRTLRDEASEWVVHWQAMGFVRHAAGTVGQGSWELFRRARSEAGIGT
jgi:SAM-dependent methyltransferase